MSINENSVCFREYCATLIKDKLQLAMIEMKYVNLALRTVNCNCYVWYINNVYVPFFNVNLNVVIGYNVHSIYHITEVNKMIT